MSRCCERRLSSHAGVVVRAAALLCCSHGYRWPCTSTSPPVQPHPQHCPTPDPHAPWPLATVLWWDSGPRDPPPGWDGCDNYTLSSEHMLMRLRRAVQTGPAALTAYQLQSSDGEALLAMLARPSWLLDAQQSSPIHTSTYHCSLLLLQPVQQHQHRVLRVRPGRIQDRWGGLGVLAQQAAHSRRTKPFLAAVPAGLPPMPPSCLCVAALSSFCSMPRRPLALPLGMLDAQLL